MNTSLAHCAFETSRLSVAPIALPASRSARDDFFDRLVTLLSSAVVAELPPYFQGIKTQEQAQIWFERMQQDSVLLPIHDQSARTLLGFVFLYQQPNSDTAHLGYLLGEAHWGQGLGKESLRGLLAWCHRHQAVNELVAGVAPDNVASRRLLTGLGFRQAAPTAEGMLSFVYELGQSRAPSSP
ncbi:GNAT family N-acetyltransferase [Ferrimonas pelagia]|uniref:GNAT family N-acetyltransferase n=1 Tax=Ferrimonas pelagia TaxID=1177826 RepID=A0ABP9FDI8_9GAMM